MLSEHLSIISSRSSTSKKSFKKVSVAKASSSLLKSSEKDKSKKLNNYDDREEEEVTPYKPRSRLAEAREELNNRKSKLEDIVNVLSVDKNNKRKKSKKKLRHHVKQMNKE